MTGCVRRAEVARRFLLHEAENINAAAENRENYQNREDDTYRWTHYCWMIRLHGLFHLEAPALSNKVSRPAWAKH